MSNNLEKYKQDIERLIEEGNLLLFAIEASCYPEQYKTALQKRYPVKKDAEKFLKNLPSFENEYQTWYSEATAVVKQIMPTRLQDFVRLYEKPRTARKQIDFENYVIEDASHGLKTTRGGMSVADRSSAIPKFQQQVRIVESLKKRFESSLFDIKQILQADLFDSELESAIELNKNGFVRAAGAVAGVVLEGHLLQVCENHAITLSKKNPTINDLSVLLKDAEVIDTPMWRNIQFLADIRNSCDHKRTVEPKVETIGELISGVNKVIKSLF